MTTSNLKSKPAHHDTCADCGGPRTGNLWSSGGNSSRPVCAACKGGPRKTKTPCPLRCGPEGLFGPACRFKAGHQQPCAPAGGNRPLETILALQLQRRAEAACG